MPKNYDVTMNNQDGFQVEWEGVLFTIRLNEHHGIMGGIAIMQEDGKTLKMLNFHGNTRGRIFPMALHETELDTVTKKERRVED